MPNHVRAVARESQASAVEPYVASFTTQLSRLGYCDGVVRQKRSFVARFVQWMERRQVGVAEIDETAIEAFLACLSRRRVPIGNRRCTLIDFLEHLRDAGATIRPEQVRDCSQAALLLQRYETYLRDDRGLTSETVCNYLRFVNVFVHAHFASAATDLDAGEPGYQEVRNFLLTSTRALAPTTSTLVATALRSFLRFLFLRGETTVDLAAAIPAVRRWRRAKVHPYLREEEVERLLAVCDCSTANGRRDHAILLLLARLGMRAGEVAAIQLSDLHWRVGEIVVRGKGRVHQRLPLLADVGCAIALYLRDGRPQSSCQSVFLRNDSPRIGLGADAVGFVVRRALGRAGLNPPSHGSHLLRFSLATTMIRRGATMAEIAEVLRHRSPETTEIYAKVDFDALRAVALPWTGQGDSL